MGKRKIGDNHAGNQICFRLYGDDRGQLVVLEEFKDKPFEIKRVYYMYDTGKGIRHGFHAHKNFKQILICIYGA